MQQLSTNTFTVAKWVVSADPTQGTHTTIQGAINSASSGDDILIRTGTYTEDLTLKVGVNISGLQGDGTEPTVTIVGNATFSGTGSATIAGVRLMTNSNPLITLSGANASVLNIRECYLNCTNNTGISFTSSNAAANLTILRSKIDLGTTGIALWSMSSVGTLNLNYVQCTNTGLSTTQSTNSAGIVNSQYCAFYSPLACSGAGIIENNYCLIDTSALNVTAITSAGTGTSIIRYGDHLSGTASGISIGAGSRINVYEGIVNSTNTNAITGAGTIKYGMVSCINSPGAINTTTIIPEGAVHIIGSTLDISDDPSASTINIGTGAAVKGVTLGSTTASSTTTIQAPSAGVFALGVQGVAVANKNYVTINTVTGALGSDAGGISSISITGDTGGALTGAAFTFTGGTTGLSFGGAGSTETLTFAGITANGGVVNLGTDSTNNAINIGTVSNTGRTITIGNVTGATGIVERIGTGNFSLDGVAASTYAIGASTVGGTITIGGTGQTGTMTLGSSSGTNIIAIGAGAGATDLQLVNNQVGGSVEIGSAMTTGTISIGGTGLQTGTVSIAPGTGAQTVNIGTGGTGVKTINIGNAAVANVITIGSTTGAAALTLNSGSVGIVAKGVASVAVSNKNYVTINTSTGALGSDAGPASGIVTLDGNSGSATGSTVTISVSASQGTPTITGSSSTLSLKFGNTTSPYNIAMGYLAGTNGNYNAYYGYNAGNATNSSGQYNAMFGYASGYQVTSGSGNAFFGFETGQNVTTGSSNTFIGQNAGKQATASSSGNTFIGNTCGFTASGSNNTAVGFSALQTTFSGSTNVAIGYNAGTGYSGAETANIVIGTNGVGGESNKTRIGYVNGTASTQTGCFIDGITGVAVTGSPVIVSSTGQLGVSSVGTIVNYVGTNHAGTPYVVAATDYYISVDVTAGVVQVNLPNAPTSNRIFVIKDKVGLAATSNITVTTVGGAVNIDGATTYVMNTAYESIQLIFNGTSYEIY